jgi:hypothetical protein
MDHTLSQLIELRARTHTPNFKDSLKFASIFKPRYTSLSILHSLFSSVVPTKNFSSSQLHQA